MAANNYQKIIASLAYFSFGALWFVVGLTSYLIDRYPFYKIAEHLWLGIIAVPLMLFTVFVFTAPKRFAKYPAWASAILIFSIILSYVYGSGHLLPRFARWLALAIGIVFVAVYYMSDKPSQRVYYGQMSGVVFVGLYFIVMIMSFMGASHGVFAFIDGIFALIYGVFLGVENL